ncbi:MAG: protein kinase, partial [Eubacteriales bacterium]|nr:protein kinase [Eubacteriales bacterium]
MIGKLLGGRYEIIEMIDTGGMAYVYKANCKKTNTFVAVKILKEKFTSIPEYVNRFKKEAQAVFSFDHENVVHVTDLGFDEGVYYMVMEYIDGPSLKTLIDEKTRIDEKEAVQYAIQICSALAAAHRKGIIHRDIKPQNILLCGDGKIKITDFGIAKSVSKEEDNEKQVLGSIYYISPEQAKGEKVDTRTDIYSLGIVLYEMLTGELPYTGDKTISVALKHINEQMTPPAEKNGRLSSSINAIILKAASKSKKDRYQSMIELKNDLVRALVDPEGSFVTLPATLITTGTKRAVFEKRNKIWKVCVLIGLAAVVISAIVAGANAFSAGSQAVVVPDSVGMTEVSAEDLLIGIGLAVDKTYETSETAEKGIVLSQSPGAGSQALVNSVIILTVSSGPADQVMPNVVNKTQEEAESVIQSLGLVLEGIEYEYSESVAAGCVISQIPEAETTISENNPVTLVISSAEAEGSIVMPQVAGMLLDQAISILSEAGLNQCFIYQDESDQEEGLVLNQSPGQGIQTTYTTEIDLWISQYTDNEYIGNVKKNIEISEKGSKIRVALEPLLMEPPFTLSKRGRRTIRDLSRWILI